MTSQSVVNYLTLYNILGAFFWGCILVRLIVLYPLVSAKFVAGGLADFVKWVQTMALLEVVHSLLGFVKSPVTTTLMQVASRLLLVWGVVDLFPDVAQSPFYSTMVLAWSITEVVRYSYYAFNLTRDHVPKLLVWIRYNAFFILYPLGAGSECVLTFLSLDDAQTMSAKYALFLKIVLLIYIPGFYILFTHMIKQRKRIMANFGRKPVHKKVE